MGAPLRLFLTTAAFLLSFRFAAPSFRPLNNKIPVARPSFVLFLLVARGPRESSQLLDSVGRNSDGSANVEAVAFLGIDVVGGSPCPSA